MPTSREQLDAMLDAAIETRAAHSDPIGGGRRLFLIHLKDLIRKSGFPLPEALKLDACSIPYVFQELNYDGYDWSTRNAELGHLADMVEIDVIVWSGGRSRNELTDAEYSAYRRFCHEAIDYRSRRHPNPPTDASA
jgi:hypothetical protein